jgi:hypothetical protein
MRQFSALALAAVLAAGIAPAAAQTVYKWKDARGVTHYSERPPAGGNYSTQESVRDPATQAVSAAPSPRTGPDPRCATARNNLATLQGGNDVQMDSDGDGKADKTLSDAERASQVELARSTLKAYNCSEDGGTPVAGVSGAN